jgi:hypothetical protein
MQQGLVPWMDSLFHPQRNPLTWLVLVILLFFLFFTVLTHLIKLLPQLKGHNQPGTGTGTGTDEQRRAIVSASLRSGARSVCVPTASCLRLSRRQLDCAPIGSCDSTAISSSFVGNNVGNRYSMYRLWLAHLHEVVLHLLRHKDACQRAQLLQGGLILFSLNLHSVAAAATMILEGA